MAPELQPAMPWRSGSREIRYSALSFGRRSSTIAADWPAVLGYVGAPLEWGGSTWATYPWALVRDADPQFRRRVMLHELFHRVQPQLKLMTSGAPNDHIDTLEGRFWLQLEWRALARALNTSGTDRAGAVADALAFRHSRRGLFPGAADSERAVEIREGLAEYTAAVVTSPTPADAVGFAISRLTRLETSTVSFVGDFGYRSGIGYSLLLDAASPGWTHRITAADDLGQLLAEALNVQPMPNAETGAARYDGPTLRASEERRDADQRLRIAELRRRFVDGPVLIMPRARSVALTGNARTPIPGVGTVVSGGYRATTEWGRLESTGAILESIDGETLRLPLPLRANGRELAGDGWTITLAAGWSVQPGTRSGDAQVVLDRK
jgi:hypothetical protein